MTATPSPSTPTATPRVRGALQALFVLSGCAALIYQSIWSHYLGLILGHAAYAQTLVLIMFMGGMGLGAWWVSHKSDRLRRPIWVYACVEAALGLLGFGFHPLFQAYSEFSQSTILPALGDPRLASAWQWLSAGLLIATQTLLLGATFPLIAAGVLRLGHERDSEALGGLYFTNSIGGAGGALLATFVLLPTLGMPGALAVAALMNLALAGGTAWIARRVGDTEAQAAAPVTFEGTLDGRLKLGTLSRALLLATFLSSASSFAYELGWVRMLNQALGSSLHSFEIMLAAFITGLALGGLWVRRRGDRIQDLVRCAGFVQVLMGLCAMASVVLLGQSFQWVSWLLQALAKSTSGYVLYILGTASISMLIMVPAAVFAGMTLPLFTAALLRQGGGERVVGRIYAANTLGAILGVLATVHLLIPTLGVSLSLLLAAGLDLLIGITLLRGFSPRRWTPQVASAACAGVVALACAAQWGLPDHLLQSLGVFRYGSVETAGRRLEYFRDGATATTSVIRTGNLAVIATNGKPDAGLTAVGSAPSADEVTMLMLGALPLALHPHPEDIALIGWGSGLSTHTVLGSGVPRRVDTIEIERTMWQGAAVLMPRNQRAYMDPRSTVHFEDAREFFARGQVQYDVLISEPSNPWVSGVASLFTREFYHLAKRSLKPEGLLVQWIHTYEISNDLLAQMLAALTSEFPNSEVYLTNSADLVIVAPKAERQPLTSTPWQAPELAAELRRVGLGSITDLQVRRLGGPALLRNFVRMQRAQAHSDFHPTVSLQAPVQRFRGQHADLLSRLVTDGLPVLNVLECRKPLGANRKVSEAIDSPMGDGHLNAVDVAQLLRSAGSLEAMRRRDAGLAQAMAALVAMRSGAVAFDLEAFHAYLGQAGQATLGLLGREALIQLWDTNAWHQAMPQLPKQALDQVRLYEAYARGDWVATQALGKSLLLEPGTKRIAALRDQALVLAMLAAQAEGQPMEVKRLNETWARQAGSPAMALTREFLLSWADSGEPACLKQAASHPPGP